MRIARSKTYLSLDSGRRDASGAERRAEDGYGNPSISLYKAAGMRQDVTAVFRYLIIATLVFTALIAKPAYSADILLIRSAHAYTPEQKQLEITTEFYGMNLRVVDLDSTSGASTLKSVRDENVRGVAIEASVLGELNQHALLRALRGVSHRSVPVLILGISQETDPRLLSAWSGGAAVGVNHLRRYPQLDYVVGQVPVITRPLSGADLPFTAQDVYSLTLSKDNEAEKILSVRTNAAVNPVFVLAMLDQQQVLLLCRASDYKTDEGTLWRSMNVVDAFSAVAPLMMFVKYVAGDAGWHWPYHYANFTIDDPWLREPYGYLNYKYLLAEMEEHNFHTTVAFIPWNYDRSNREVVSLFRSHPDRFSVSIHGDNHDHKEFEGFDSKPLKVQDAALKQALARMDEFRNLTGLPYDRVFIFPHSIGEEPVLEKLKAYNFLATVNSVNFPMGTASPTDPLWSLRPVTTSYADFPSIVRSSVESPQLSPLIEVNEFLGNPLLFYDHQGLFARGINAFDDVANKVNREEPATRWSSLGDITNHLFLMRLRPDASYDVFTYSASIRLENNSKRALRYHIIKREASPSTLSAVTIDASVTPFTIEDGFLECTVSIPARGARDVEITYKNSLDLASVDIKRRSLRVFLLRRISDFRDISLSQSHFGELATTVYYSKTGTRKVLVIIAGLVMLLAGAVLWSLFAIKRKRKPAVALVHSGD